MPQTPILRPASLWPEQFQLGSLQDEQKEETSDTDVKNAYLNILESHSFPADFNYSGNTEFDGNILYVDLSLNSLNWVDW